MKIPVYGWKAWKLSDLSFEDLSTLRETIINDPKNHAPRNAHGHPRSGIYLYTPAARRKLDALSWAVTYKIQERRKLERDPGKKPRHLRLVQSHRDMLRAMKTYQLRILLKRLEAKMHTTSRSLADEDEIRLVRAELRRRTS